MKGINESVVEGKCHGCREVWREGAIQGIYRVRINYRRISLRHNLSRKCRKIVEFVSITHSEDRQCLRRPTTSKDTTSIARAHQRRNPERHTRHA